MKKKLQKVAKVSTKTFYNNFSFLNNIFFFTATSRRESQPSLTLRLQQLEIDDFRNRYRH
jgi:hypothetical protein